MSHNSQTLKAALSEKFGNAVFHFTVQNSVQGFFVNPSSQMAVFNFLFFDEQWKYDVLKDINFLYDADNAVTEYSLQYILSNRLQKNDLHVFLPVAFTDPKANSLVHLYKTAEKYEQIIAEVYNVEFVSKKTRLNDFMLVSGEDQHATFAETSAEAVTINEKETSVAPLLTDTSLPEAGVPIKRTPRKAAKSMAASLAAAAIPDSTYAGNNKQRSNTPQFFGRQRFAAIFSLFHTPGKAGLKYLFYATPLVLAIALYGILKIAGNSNNAKAVMPAPLVESSPEDLQNTAALEPSKDGNYTVFAPAGGPVTVTPPGTTVKNAALKLPDDKTKQTSKETGKLAKDATMKQTTSQLAPPQTASPDPQAFNNQPDITPISTNEAVNNEPGKQEPSRNFTAMPAFNTAPVANNTATVVKTEQNTQGNLANTGEYQKPAFPGGASAMSRYLNRKLRVPDEALSNNVNGNVVVKFMVDTNGNISDIVLSKKLGYGCDEVVENVIKSMPKWVPGKINGAVQKMPVMLSVKFEVRNNQ